MNRFNRFLTTTMIGGIGIVLPIAILVFLFVWLFYIIVDIITPVAELVTLGTRVSTLLSYVIAIGTIILGCFLIGLFVRTRFGRFFHNVIEREILKRIPGYRILREIVEVFTGGKEMPFSSVVLVRPFDNETLMTGFITQRHPGDLVTVFVPTGPNPTSGNIYHIHKKNILDSEVPVEEGIKSVVGCGVGSTTIIQRTHPLL